MVGGHLAKGPENENQRRGNGINSVKKACLSVSAKGRDERQSSRLALGCVMVFGTFHFDAGHWFGLNPNYWKLFQPEG